MNGYHDDIEQATKANDDFRRVLYTGKHLQLVLMSLKPGEEIGAEVHPDNDQFFRVDSGSGVVTIDGQDSKISDGYAVVVPAGARHNVRNDGTEPLKLYTLYGPPDHKDKTVHKTKGDAEANHAADHWDGKTTE
ncbi:MAG: cupin domain-containing protein [Sphingomicrobium sp.]